MPMKYINGKLYEKIDGYYDTKAGKEHAQRDAKKWRESGYNARILKYKKGIALFTHRKRKR